jgi:SAM-dependent methyltransferase
VIDEYGESFADVYDQWYPREAAAVEVVGALPAPPGGHLLEVGVGTGALAFALAAEGWEVTGIDSSAAMLERFEAKRVPATTAQAVRADAGDPSSWPPGPFHVVLAAWNVVTNLWDRDAQRAMFAGAADVLVAGGRLVVEAFVPAAPVRRERRVTTSVASSGDLVRVHTDVDPRAGIVAGRHVEFSADRVTVRPWRLCWATPDELDEMAEVAGFVLRARHADWAGAPYERLDSDHHVSWYVRREGGGEPTAR